MSRRSREKELYEPVRLWLERYLRNNLPAFDIHAFDSHKEFLSKILRRLGMKGKIRGCEHFDLYVDVAAVAVSAREARLFIVECKADSLTLRDFGQLLGYSLITDPWKALLLSPAGQSKELAKFLVTRQLTKILTYGEMKRKIIVGTWNKAQSEPEFGRLVPKHSLNPTQLLIP